MNPINVRKESIWKEIISDDIEFDTFKLMVANRKGWEYQYIVLNLAMTRPADQNKFLSLITRNKDFDPMLVAINEEFDYKTRVGPFLLNALKDESLSNRAVILETFFPVRVRQETLDIEYIKNHLNVMSQIGVRISLLTVVISWCLFTYYDPNKLKEVWKQNYDGQPFSQMYLDDETFEIDTLYMIVDGNGSDLNMGQDECQAVIAMVLIAESFLDLYENNYTIGIYLSNQVDEDSANDKIADVLMLHKRREISEHVNKKFAAYYNRIFSEFVQNITESRFIYWNTLTLLFSEYKINPYFILYEERFKKPEFQKRYLTCMIQILIRLKDDIQAIDNGNTPYDAYSGKVDVVARNNMVDRESIALVYVYFALLAADQINLVVNNENLDRSLISAFCHETLDEKQVSEIVEKFGYIFLYQLSDFLITFANPKFAASMVNPLFSDTKNVKNNGLDSLVANIEKINFKNESTNKETRFLYFDGNNYVITSIKSRFEVLLGYETCINCGRKQFELN